MNKLQLLLKCTGMVLKSGVCPDTKASDWPKLIMFAHSKGYLYVSKDADTFVCAYRIPADEDVYKNEMPVEESGDLLYVAWAVSESNSRTNLLKMLKQYRKENNVKEIIYYKRNSNTNLKRITFKELVHE